MTQDEIRAMVEAKGFTLPYGPIDQRPGARIRVHLSAMAGMLEFVMRPFR